MKFLFFLQEVKFSTIFTHFYSLSFALTVFKGGGLLVSLYNAPNFLSVSEGTRFSSLVVPSILCPPLNFSCFHSYLPTLRSKIGYVAIWSGFLMSPCSPNSNGDSLFHFKLSPGVCPVNESRVCRILQQNTLKVVLNDAVIIDTSFSDLFQESLTVRCRLWSGGLNSVQIWWRHQRLPNFDDIQLQVTTSCSSRMTLPSSLWFYSNEDDTLSGSWPRRIVIEGNFTPYIS